MSKYKNEDYKINAVNYYLDNDVSMDYVCNILIVITRHEPFPTTKYNKPINKK